MVPYCLAPLGRKSSAASVLSISTFLPLRANPAARGGASHGPIRAWLAPLRCGTARMARTGQTDSAMERTDNVASPAKIASQTTRPMIR